MANNESNRNFEQNLWTPYPQHTGLQSATPLAVLQIASAVPSIFLNGCVLYILVKQQRLRNRPSAAFMISLTIADLIVSAIGQPLTVTILLNSRSYSVTESHINLQRNAFYINCVTCSASASSLLLVSLDRYIYVAFPLKYELIMTKPKLIVGLVSVWLGSLVSGLTPWFKGAKMYIYYYFVLFALVFIVIVMMFVYWRTTSIARALIHPAGFNSQTDDSWKRAARTGVVLVSIFVFCWFPFSIIGLMLSLHSQKEAWDRKENQLPQAVTATPPITVDLFFFTLLLGHLNSLCNPIIYSARDSHIKEQLYRLFRITKLDENLRRSKVSSATVASMVSISNTT